MSEQSPPPKPKIGSLRDRIAAFEKQADSSSSSHPAPPPPRPKPAGFASWKPRAASPPPPPSNTDEKGAAPGSGAGMSANDAKESIGIGGGSLKERMAALQGRGAFGAPTPPVSQSKPTVERPKWKPPPRVVSPPVDPEAQPPVATSPPPAAVSPESQEDQNKDKPATEEDKKEGDEEGAEKAVSAEGEGGSEPDPEEEERQRRAAIAARMARLGGARFGMGAPMFARPKSPPARPRSPPVRAVSPPTIRAASPPVQRAKSPALEGEPRAADTEVKSPPPPVQAPAEKTEDESHKEEQSEDTPSVPQSESTPEVKSPEPVQPAASPEPAPIASPPPAARSPPTSMPVPAGPRRAAPPRRKPPTVTSPEPAEAVTPTPDVDVVAASLSSEKLDEVPEGIKVLPEEKGEQIPAQAPSTTVEEEKETPKSPEIIPAATESVSEKEPSKIDTVDVGLTQHKDASEEDLTSKAEEDKPIRDEVAEPEPDKLPEKEVVEEPLNVQEEETKEQEPKPALADEPSPAAAAAEEGEEDEEARKQRVAERLAKMGGFNPFAGAPPTSPPLPPKRQGSTSSSILSPKAPEIQPRVEEKEEEPEVEKQQIEEAPVVVELEGQTAKEEVEAKKQEEAKAEGDEEEEEEAARKRRVAERMAKMGGVNPFAGAPPQRKSSTTTATTAEVVSPPVERPPSPVAQVIEEKEKENELEQLNTLRRNDSTPLGKQDQVGQDQVVTTPVPSRLLPPRPISETFEDDRDGDEDEESFYEDADEPQSAVSTASRLKTARSIPRLAPQQSDDEGLGRDEDTNQFEVQVEAEAGDIVRETGANQVEEVSVSPPPMEDERLGRLKREDPIPRDLSPSPALPVPPRRPTHRSNLPPPPPLESEDERDEPESVGASVGIVAPAPRTIPPPPPIPAHASEEEDKEEEEEQVKEVREEILPVSPRTSMTGPSFLTAVQSSTSDGENHESEVLDEDEGDPIDPSFHTPFKRQSATVVPPAPTSPPPAPPRVENLERTKEEVEEPEKEAEKKTEEQGEEDAEVARRKTIAERMAKLGGIRFGAAPPMPISRPPPPPPPQEQEAGGASVSTAPAPEEHAEQDQERELTEEEEEAARKRRIAAKLGSMGGMRIGMLPPSPSIPPPPAVQVPPPPSIPPPSSPPMRKQSVDQPPQRKQSIESTGYAPPPPPSRPPPPPQPLQEDSEHESITTTSDEGVKVEAEESEAEEVSRQEVEEDEPPPLPTREGRPTRLPPAPPANPARKASFSSVSTTIAGQSQHKGSAGEYILVDEPEQTSSPPTRHAPPPTRRAPTPPQSEPTESISSHWELPSIPASSLTYDNTGPVSAISELSESWADVSGPPTIDSFLKPLPTVGQQTYMIPDDLQLSPEDLMSVWGKVGVHICEAATTMYDKSKKSLIGDGSFHSFVDLAIKQVPSALYPLDGPSTYGYLIYQQTAGSVQKRVADIMPGDIVCLSDARFKGHKGLQAYHINVGEDGIPLVGVVTDFDPRKSKLRVLQANQHVGQQTVESVGYRFEDLKSGVIKVFRVLEL